MSKLTEAIAAPTTRLCSVAKAIADLEESDPASHADFQDWLDGKLPYITDIAVWAGLQRLGFRVGKQTIGRHRRRRGECGCTQ